MGLRKSFFTKAITGFLSAGLASTAFGSMVLDKYEISLDPPARGQRYARSHITVTNISTEELLLETEVQRVHNQGTDQEKIVPVRELSNMALLVTPGRATIQPEQKKKIQILSTHPPAREQEAYRVLFWSALPEGAIARGEMTKARQEVVVIVHPQEKK